MSNDDIEVRLAVLEQSIKGCRERETLWQTTHDKEAKEFRDFIKETVTSINKKFVDTEVCITLFKDKVEEKIDGMNWKLAKITGGGIVFWTIVTWVLQKYFK